MFYPNRIRLNEFKILKEQDDDATAGGPYTPPQERILQTPNAFDSLGEREASVDQKIDSYLMKFEKEAVPLDNKEEMGVEGRERAAESGTLEESGKKLYKLIFEQDAPADAGGGDAAGADDTAGGGGDTGGGPSPGAAAPVAPVPKINIRKFAEGVARLVNNYQTLVDPKTIILNRAMYYIAKNYSPRLAKELMSILQKDFDLTTKTKAEKEAEYPEAPTQANAGPDSGGGVPSGGGGSSS